MPQGSDRSNRDVEARVTLFFPSVSVVRPEPDDGRDPEWLKVSGPLPEVPPYLVPALDDWLRCFCRHASCDRAVRFEGGEELRIDSIGLLRGQPTGIGWLSGSFLGGSLSQVQDAIAYLCFHTREEYVPAVRLADDRHWPIVLRELFAGHFLKVGEWPDSRCWVAIAYSLDNAPGVEALRSLVDVDQSSGFEADKEWASEWLAQRTYRRWKAQGVVYGFTHHSFVGVQWSKEHSRFGIAGQFVPPIGPYFQLALTWLAAHRNHLRGCGAADAGVLPLPTALRTGWISHNDQGRALWRTWSGATSLDGGKP